MRKTKVVCTIGPTSCSRENLFKLADAVRLQQLHLAMEACNRVHVKVMFSQQYL